MMSPIAAKLILTVGSAVAAGFAIIHGYHYGMAFALQHVPVWTHGYGILSRF